MCHLVVSNGKHLVDVGVHSHPFPTRVCHEAVPITERLERIVE